MKKALSVFLACLMLFGCLAFSAAAEGEPGNYDSDLLALYDFEGEEPFANKAPNGKSATLLETARTGYGSDGKIQVNTNAPGTLPVENNVVTVSGEEGTSLYMNANTRKAIMSDNIYNKTYFAKLKASGEVKVANTQAVFGHRSHEFSLIFAAGSTGTNFSFQFRHVVTTANAASAKTLTVKAESIPANNTPAPVENEWYYVAMSFGDHDAVNSILPVDILLSNDGKNYSVTHFDVAVDTATLAKSFTNCYWNFGKTVHTALSGAGENKGMDISFDKIAFYNRSLTANELALHTLGFTAPSSDIAVKGYQTTTPANDLFNVRFVGSINNVENYKKVGFTVLFSNALGTTKTVEVTSTTVYLSLNATDASGNVYEAINAADQGVDALFALRVEDVPVTGTYTVTVVGTAVTTSDELVNTASYTYRLVDGVFTPAA